MGRAVRDGAGNIVEVAGAFQDISERREAAAREAALRDQLGQAQKLESLGRLAGGVAHDFNNMLHVIIGRAEIACERLPEADPTRADLQEILGAARHSADITRQLLGFARRQIIEPRPIDLQETVGRSIRMLRRLIGEQIELTFRPGARVPMIHADPSQVDQILANLCVNAADAIEGNGRIEVSADSVFLPATSADLPPEVAPGQFVRLAVHDDGCGMDGETLAHAFEPFFTTKGPGKGTGLGLATVYGISRQNGGFARIESAPGRGTEVRVFFPALAVVEAGGGEREGVAPPPAARPGETVLLVEDEPGVRLLCESLLASLGYRVIACASAVEALGRDPAERIDLLLADVVMPGLSGPQLAERLCGRCPGLRVLYMSGYTPEEISRHLRGGAADCLRKPFTKAAFAEALRRALDGGPEGGRA